ncbi:MAG TPA: spermidine/putrescine ABC transporter substrate-binding protein, partial [Pirellulales bacterium]|nr:spermidine/putrescine ABC transporter substrate-binding protein [Pirellulales bacterium]
MNALRRTLLLFGFIGGITAIATGCSKSGDKPVSVLPFDGQTLNVFNWSDYIDPELIAEFEARTGAHVQYDTYSSDSELETKVLAGGGGYDVIFPSDRSIPMMLNKKLLARLDKALLPNWKHLDQKFLNAPYDPKSEYGAPYFWGTVAVGIRTDHVTGDVKGFEVLFDEQYRDHITMLDDPEHVVAVALMQLGLPMNSTEDA